LFVDLTSVFKDVLFTAVMSVIGSDELNRTVKVNGVVPDDEVVHPPLGRFDRVKGL
jgi:hypothetical protein